MTLTLLSVKKKLTDYAAITDKGTTENAVYQVVVSSNTATPVEVAALSGTVGGVNLPAYRQVHDINPNMYVTSKQAKRESGGKAPARNVWLVEVGYTDQVATYGQSETSANIQVAIKGSKQTFQTQMAYDDDNEPTPILNSVNDLYPDPQDVTFYDEIITIDYETGSIDGDSIASLRGKMNNSPITISIPQGDLPYSRTFADKTIIFECDYGASVSRTEDHETTWKVQVTLYWREDTWAKKLPQKGYRWFAHVAGGEEGDFDLTEWKEHAEYLDAAGKKLDSGDAVVPTSPKNLNKLADLNTFLMTI